MQLSIIVKPFTNVFCVRTETYIMLMIRYVTLCPHIVGFRELSSPLVDQSASWRIRELSSNLEYDPEYH